eukprot:scaffold461_cov157-Ochromonas_danica.AAC.3
MPRPHSGLKRIPGYSLQRKGREERMINSDQHRPQQLFVFSTLLPGCQNTSIGRRYNASIVF